MEVNVRRWDRKFSFTVIYGDYLEGEQKKEKLGKKV